MWTGTREVQSVLGEVERGMRGGHPTPAGPRSWAFSRGTGSKTESEEGQNVTGAVHGMLACAVD